MYTTLHTMNLHSSTSSGVVVVTVVVVAVVVVPKPAVVLTSAGFPSQNVCITKKQYVTVVGIGKLTNAVL